jgi:hypothetical protein
MSEDGKQQETGATQPAAPVEGGKGDDAKASGDRNARWAKAGIGAAIGSAAIMAALLYVNHAKRNDRSS